MTGRCTLARLLAKLGKLFLILIGYCIPKRDDLWVFGCRHGQFYNDNARFLFEHVLAAHPDVRAVWITRNPGIYRYLKRHRRSVFMADSLRGFYHTARARVAIICVDHPDVMPYALARTRVVHLWHGVQFKVSHGSYRYNQRRDGSMIEKLVSLIRRVDLVTTTAPNQIAPLSGLLGVDKRLIKVTGFPKMDVLFSRNRPAENLSSLFGIPVPEDKRIVLYLPAWRPPLGQPYDLFFRYGFDAERMESLLSSHNALLIYVPHYVTPVCEGAFLDRWKHSQHLMVYDRRSAFFDPNLVYPRVAVLITDYSSVFLNFLSQDRPVIFTPFDLDYFSRHVGLPFDYPSYTPGPKAYDWPAVFGCLDNALRGIDDYRQERKRILDQFHFFKDTDSGRRVVSEIRKLAGLPRITRSW